MNDIENSYNIFESIKHIDENGNEYWSARELQKALEYSKWERFSSVIDNAKIACTKSGFNVNDHFPDVGKMVKIGSKTSRTVVDYKLSRYACYLIALNGDPRKDIISLAQTYFTFKTRKQELLEEDEMRLLTRNKIRKGNKNLNKLARKAGVKRLAEFHNAGYKGLYNGETANDIYKRKKLRYREDILDNMGSIELGANIFRITQTADRLEKNKVDNPYDANATHYKIGKDIREFIKSTGGTMPEDLPTPKRSLKEIEKDVNNILK